MAYTIPKSDINEGGGFELIPEGWHRLKVAKCSEKTSRKGEKMLNLELYKSGTDLKLWDIIMLEGAGNGIGTTKLLAMGAATDLGDTLSILEPHEIEGIEAWGYVIHSKYEGKDQAKIGIRFGEAGYLPLTNPPAGYGAGGGAQAVDPAEDDDDIPF